LAGAAAGGFCADAGAAMPLNTNATASRPTMAQQRSWPRRKQLLLNSVPTLQRQANPNRASGCALYGTA
jgi:hypothetical protein